MFNFRITYDNGTVCLIRARSRRVAVRLFCLSEGCTPEWVRLHCTVRKEKGIQPRIQKNNRLSGEPDRRLHNAIS